MGGPIQPSSEGLYSIPHEGKTGPMRKVPRFLSPLGSGPILAEICNLFAFPLARRGKLITSAGSIGFINHLPLLRNTRRTEGKWRITFPTCIEGKCATSNRGMVHINPLDFVTEVYLLTLFPLVRKKHRTGENKGGGTIFHLLKRGCGPLLPKILINYIHPSIEKLIRRGNGESHSPHTEWNGPSLSEM